MSLSKVLPRSYTRGDWTCKEAIRGNAWERKWRRRRRLGELRGQNAVRPPGKDGREPGGAAPGLARNLRKVGQAAGESVSSRRPCRHPGSPREGPALITTPCSATGWGHPARAGLGANTAAGPLVSLPVTGGLCSTFLGPPWASLKSLISVTGAINSDLRPPLQPYPVPFLFCFVFAPTLSRLLSSPEHTMLLFTTALCILYPLTRKVILIPSTPWLSYLLYSAFTLVFT